MKARGKVCACLVERERVCSAYMFDLFWIIGLVLVECNVGRGKGM